LRRRLLVVCVSEDENGASWEAATSTGRPRGRVNRDERVNAVRLVSASRSWVKSEALAPEPKRSFG
jgi:hypothetical protein